MEELLKNIENCPVLVIYIIIQIVIQGYDFYKRNFIAAFIHFWLGFIFYISYKNTLCTEKNVSLGIEKILIVLAFVFCQIVLLRISNTINRVKITDTKPKKGKEETEELKKDNNLIDFWNRNIGKDLDNYIKMSIKSNKGDNKIDTNIKNIKKFGLSRGTEMKLKNGKIVSITGFEYKKDKDGMGRYKSSVESDDDFEYMDVTLNLDKSINYNESFIYIKVGGDDVNKKFNKNSSINDSIGNKDRQLKERLGEIGKNISLLKDEIKKKEKMFKKNIKDKSDKIKEELEKEHKIIIDKLNYDLKKQEKIFSSMTGQSDSLMKHRDKIIKEMEKLKEEMK